MKKYFVSVLVLILLLSTAACSRSPDTTNLTAAATDATAAPSTAQTGPGSALHTEPTNAAVTYESMTLSGGKDVTVAFEYPSAFTYSEELTDSFSWATVQAGRIIGSEYFIAFGFGQLGDYYDSFDTFLQQFSTNDLYREINCNGAAGIIKQSGENVMTAFLPYTQSKYVVINTVLVNGGTTEDYTYVLESPQFQHFLNSITVTSAGNE